MNVQGSRRALLILMAVCAMSVLTVGAASAESTWVDELANSLTFYQTSYPGSNWEPYVEKVARIRNGIDRGDQQIVMVEMDEFIRMLRTQAHGINDVAANELSHVVVTVSSADSQPSASAIELETVNELLISVPQHTINTPYQEGPPCRPGGCDYWLDDVFDAGAQ